MTRESTMPRARLERMSDLAGRIREIRRDRFGDDVVLLADALDLSPRTWLNYEAGVVLPPETLLRFMSLTGISPGWLATGRGLRFDELSFDVGCLETPGEGLGPS